MRDCQNLIMVALLTAALVATAADPAAPVAPPRGTPTPKRVTFADRGGYWLEKGKSTAVVLELRNHNTDRERSLRMRIDVTGDWLDVRPQAPAVRDPLAPGVWRFDQDVPAGGGLLRVPLTFEVKAETGAEGARRPTLTRDQASVAFTLWRERDNPGASPTDRAGGADRLPVPARRCWVVKYVVRAATPELALPPPPMQWHLAAMDRGQTRTIEVEIRNLNDYQPLNNVLAIPECNRAFIKVSAAEAGNITSIKSVPGVNVIKPQATGRFSAVLSADAAAQPGDAATIRFDVRSSTPGTTPSPWEPHVLAFIEQSDYEVAGNFEAYLYYNLPPLADSAEARPGADSTDWIPVPKGTKISVSQVYTLPGAAGEKYVEQFVGYGNVLDDRGYVCCTISPVNEHNTRLRLVAETMASEMELTYADRDGKPVLTACKARQARAAVAPFGKRPFRSISHTFLADLERGTTRRGEKTLRFYRPRDTQDHHFISGNRILLPYFGYEKVVNPTAREGILINWEGELSTDGIINFFSLGADGGMAGLGASFTRMGEYATGADLGADASRELLAQGTPGLIYHNRNELLHILSTLIRAQDFLSTLSFFHDGTPERPAPPLPGVVAMWRKMDLVPDGETGYALQPDGTHRLVVQSRAEDPDERDAALVARGYGAALRRQFFGQTGTPPSDAEQARPRYHYYTRVSVAQAWQEGFDIFFAACTLNSPKVLNRVVGPDNREAAESRSVDLDEVLRKARTFSGERLYDPEARRVRGADNPVAVAAGLWTAGRRLSAVRLTNFLLERQGGNLGQFLEYVAAESPALLLDMMDLGLCPRVKRWPPPESIHTGVHPQKAMILWDPNDMLDKGRLTGELLFGSATGGRRTVQPLEAAERGPVVVDFGKLRDQDAGKSALMARPRINEDCLWTIRTVFDKDQEFTWPLQSIAFSSPTLDLAGHGARLALGPDSHLDVGPSAGRVAGQTQRIDSILDGKTVLGRAVQRIGYIPPGEETEELVDFPEPAELVLSWNRDQDPGDATPGIYYLDPVSERWELVSEERVGARGVKAMISRPGAYALMIDQAPPQIEDLDVGPNPLISSVDGAAWRLSGRLSEAATLGLAIRDRAGKPVAVLLEAAALPVGEFSAAWDGRDAAGAAVPDGLYAYELTARDRSGLDARPITGSIQVFNGDFGAASGRVTLARATNVTIEVRAAGLDVGAACDPAGSYWLPGLPPGAHFLRASAAGFFDESQRIVVGAEGDEVEAPAIALTHLAVDGLTASSETFTPDGDGRNDYVEVRFNGLRTCPYEVVVDDGEGGALATLLPKKTLMPGRQVATWNGERDGGEALPSGWYTIRARAWNRDEDLPQGELRVLLDRGLVQDAHAFPNTFSPNGDGFDDILQVGFNMEGEGSVALNILTTGGALVRAVHTNTVMRPGWRTLEWDGRGRDGEIVPDGRYRFELVPYYPGGYASKTAAGELGVDCRPPELGGLEPANGSTVTNGMPTLTVRILSDIADIDPDQLKFKIDEQTVKADTIDLAKRVFAYTPRTSLGAGGHIGIAYAQDWAGNYAPPQAVSFKVELAPPGGTFIDRTPPEVLELEPGKDAIVYTPTPLLRARVRDGESGIDANNIAIEINGVKVAGSVTRFIPGKSGKPWDWYSYEKALVMYDPLEGEVRYVPMEPLPPGKNHVAVQVLDRAGNRSVRCETIFDVVVDDAKPEVTIEAPRHGARLARPEVVIEAVVRDRGRSGLALETLELRVDGDITAWSTNTLAFDEKTGALRFALPAPLERNAQHAVAISVRDRAGNLSDPASSVFSIVEDAEAPRIDLLSPRSGAQVPKALPVQVVAAVYDVGRAGLDEAWLQVLIDGVAVPRFDPGAQKAEGFVFSGGMIRYQARDLAPGRHELEIRCRDLAGNEAAPARCEFVVK